MSRNFRSFLKLDVSSLADQYVVFMDEKLVAKGKDIVLMLKNTRKKYPGKTPFVAKIPDKSALVL